MMLIFTGAPFVESLRANRRLSGALAAITAAVVGVIVNLALFGSARSTLRMVASGAISQGALLEPAASGRVQTLGAGAGTHHVVGIEQAKRKNRVFAIGGASDGPYGALRSLMALRQSLELGCGALVIPDQITVIRASEAFDEMDNLKDERAAGTLKRIAQRLTDMAREMA